jgi:hypothetical protein
VLAACPGMPSPRHPHAADWHDTAVIGSQMRPTGTNIQYPANFYSIRRARNRNALPMTEIDDRLIAAAANIGFNNSPNHG